MTHFIYRLTFLLALLVGLAGCNSEVFVKPLKISTTQVELNEETKDVSLTVSGGEWELYNVYSEDIDLLRGDWSYKYYDENGKGLSDYELGGANLKSYTFIYIYKGSGIEFWVTRRPWCEGLDISLKRYDYYKPVNLMVIVGNDYNSASVNVTLK